MSVRRISLCSLRSGTSARGSKSGISPATCVGQCVASHWRIGPSAERPASTVARMSAGRMPAAQTAPAPVITTRGAVTSVPPGRPKALTRPPRGAASKASVGAVPFYAPSPGRPSTSSGCRSTMQLFEPPKPNELEIAIRTRCRAGAPTTKFRSQSGSRSA